MKLPSPDLDARLRALDGDARVIVLVEAPPGRVRPRPGVTFHWVDASAAFGPRTLNDALKALFLPQSALRVWVSWRKPARRGLFAKQLIEDHGSPPRKPRRAGHPGAGALRA
ncbi:MAG: hypothetical protein WDN06_18500 [Asticcacaulis sp.]